MGKHLDLEDVVHGHPLAEQELKELREEATRLESELRKFKRGGRKPIGKKAMSDAERQRRKYAKKKAAQAQKKDA